MPDAITGHGPLERLGHVLLCGHLTETAGPVLPG